MNACLSNLHPIQYLISQKSIPTIAILLIPHAHIFQDSLEYLLYKISASLHLFLPLFYFLLPFPLFLIPFVFFISHVIV